jgi:flagellin-specific chaperone FliS
MGIEKVVSPQQLVLLLADNLQQDINKLSVAILRENKHDMCTHIGSALERSQELKERISALPGPAR